MAARGHFVFPIDAKNHKVLIIWDFNGYGEYEFDSGLYVNTCPIANGKSFAMSGKSIPQHTCPTWQVPCDIVFVIFLHEHFRLQNVKINVNTFTFITKLFIKQDITLAHV